MPVFRKLYQVSDRGYLLAYQSHPVDETVRRDRDFFTRIKCLDITVAAGKLALQERKEVSESDVVVSVVSRYIGDHFKTIEMDKKTGDILIKLSSILPSSSSSSLRSKTKRVSFGGAALLFTLKFTVTDGGILLTVVEDDRIRVHTLVDKKLFVVPSKFVHSSSFVLSSPKAEVKEASDTSTPPDPGDMEATELLLKPIDEMLS